MGTNVDKSLILNKIKFHYGFKSDADFARFLEIKPNTLSNWYVRNTMDHERVYTKCEDIDGNFILTGKEPMLKSSNSVNEPAASYFTDKQPQVITIDSHNQDNIVLVPQKLKAGYLQGYNDPKFISKLPTFRMPGLNNGVFRMFPVEGNSMFPTLTNNSYVVGQFVENWIKDIKDNRIYIIISNELEDGLVKRVINRIDKYNNLICKSDNRRNFPTQNINPSSIKEIWEVKLHLNFDLPDPGELYDRMNDLEAEMEEMKRKLLK